MPTVCCCVHRGRRPGPVHRELRATGRPARRLARRPFRSARPQSCANGNDVTVIALQPHVADACLAAARRSPRKASRSRCIDLRTISPWTRDRARLGREDGARAWSCTRPSRVRRRRRDLRVHQRRTVRPVQGPGPARSAALCAVPFSKPLETAFMPSSPRSRPRSAGRSADPRLVRESFPNGY